MPEAPPKIIISHGTQIKANMTWSFIDQGVQMAIGDEACNHIPITTPCLSATGIRLAGKPHDLSMLSSTIDDAGEKEMPHKQASCLVLLTKLTRRKAK